MGTAYRYKLQVYAGPASRYTCPACERHKQFARYIDTKTEELLPPEFGMCNRVDNCGYHLSPYHAALTGVSWAKQQHLDTHLNHHRTTFSRSALQPQKKLASSVVATVPVDLVKATLRNYERNNLAQVMRWHFGAGVADELIARFQLGTSGHWPGATVFWLFDEHGRARGGQVVLYDETGHTVKKPRRCTTWVHTALAAHCRQQRLPVPDWLTTYSSPEVPKSPCLFGLSQLASSPASQPVAIVESAKTAIFCTPYLAEFCWLATMGKTYLTPERLAPLKSRRLILFPDANALVDWQGRSQELRRAGFTVSVSDYLESTATSEQMAAGYDLADLLLSEWQGFPPSW